MAYFETKKHHREVTRGLLLPTHRHPHYPFHGCLANHISACINIMSSQPEMEATSSDPIDTVIEKLLR